MKERISLTLDPEIIKNVDSLVDGLYLRSRSQVIEELLEKSISDSKTAIILCGGKCLKMENGKFKITAKFLDSTVIEYNLNGLRKNGFKKVIIIGTKDVLIELFKKIGNGELFGLAIEYIEDNPNSQGSMDTLKCLRKINKTVLVAFGDSIYGENNLRNFWKTHTTYKGIATLLVQASTEKVENAGVVIMDGNLVKKFLQKPGNRLSMIWFSGLFIVEPEFFNYSGPSAEGNVFPQLAEKSLLRAYVCPQHTYHFHTKKELCGIEKTIKKSGPA